MIVEVAFLPALLGDLSSKVCIVVDVLRATSTLVSMFEAGARRVLLAETHASALSFAEKVADRPAVCGESGGLAPVGFDFGNSPREFVPDSLRDRDVVFCTSNGTKAMRAAASARAALAGSLLNGSAVVEAALDEGRLQDLDITLVCSGDYLGARFAVDDAFCAGYLVSLLGAAAQRGTALMEVTLDESAVAAVRLYRSYLLEAGIAEASSVPPKEVILRAFWESHNAAVLRRVGLAEDVEYCAQLDISGAVPRLRVEDGDLVLYASRQGDQPAGENAHP